MCERVILVQSKIHFMKKVSFIHLLVLFCFLLDRGSNLVRFMSLNDYSGRGRAEGEGGGHYSVTGCG